MDPLAPNPNLTPPQPKKRWPLSKPVTIIIASVLGVILIAVTLFAVFGGKKDDQKSADTSDSSIYYNREGYNPESYQPKIGDPFAVDFTKPGKVIEMGGTAVISGCNIVTVNDLKKEDILIGTHSAPKSILRTFFDGVGDAAYPPSKYSLPTGGSAEECHYIFEDGKDIDVTVYQPPMTPASLIKKELAERYKTVSGITLSGAELFERSGTNSGDRKTYIVSQGDIAVRVSSTIKDKAKLETLLQVVADNAKSEQAKPTGAPLVAYNTPTFKKSVAKACDLITNADIKQLTGNDASPLVEEGIAPSTGVTKVNEQLRNFIQSDCTRNNIGLGSSIGGSATFNQSLNVLTTTYQENDGAKYQFESIKKEQKDTVAIDGVGDGAFAYKDTAGQNTVLLYSGRFVAEIVLNRTSQQGGLENTATMAEKLTPFIESVVEKLGKL